MQKPIEPGCLAIIVGGTEASENKGCTVTVIRGLAPKHQIGYGGMRVENNSQDFAWVVESPQIFAKRQDNVKVQIGWALVRNSHLRRIDDYKPDADDLALYNRHGKLESSNPCQTKQSRFTTRAS